MMNGSANSSSRNLGSNSRIPQLVQRGLETSYEPDFLVRLINDVTLILEIKGYEVHGKEQNSAKHNAAKKWVTAVNNLGDFGQWDFLVCRDLETLLPMMAELLDMETTAVSMKKEGDLF